MKRSRGLQKFTGNSAKKQFGVSQTEAKEKGICVFCHKKINLKNFRDELSIKEYKILGLCQKCQDKTFGV